MIVTWKVPIERSKPTEDDMGTVTKCLLIGGSLVLGSQAAADPMQWSENGHWYMPVSGLSFISWDEANAAATNLGGYLVTITSNEENAFVFGLIDDEAFWFLFQGANQSGPWIGGFQPEGASEPAGGWAWVTGEPFVYSAWGSGQPNNATAPGQDRIHFWSPTTRTAATWNDLFSGNTNDVLAYVVEWDDSSAFCPTDINGSGAVNVHDLVRLLLCFGQPALPECQAEDINLDGTVDVLDLIDLLLAFGTACP